MFNVKKILVSASSRTFTFSKNKITGQYEIKCCDNIFGKHFDYRKAYKHFVLLNKIRLSINDGSFKRTKIFSFQMR